MGTRFYITHPQSNANICFSCKKACGGCSWSEYDPVKNSPRFEPVPGWTAEQVTLNLGMGDGKRRLVDTYHITACPEFEPDDDRESTPGELTDEQLKFLLSKWRRDGELM